MGPGYNEERRMWVIRAGEILGDDDHIIEVGADEVVDDMNITVSTGYQTPAVMTHTLDLIWDGIQEDWNAQHPRGPHLDTFNCEWCDMTVLVLHNEGEGSTQALWDDHEWYSMPNNDTICQECRTDRTSQCSHCTESFRIDGNEVYDGDEVYCDEECASQARDDRMDDSSPNASGIEMNEGPGDLPRQDQSAGAKKPTKELVIKKKKKKKKKKKS